MLSSNIATCYSNGINIHLCKHLFTLLCVTVSSWTSPFVVQVHDDRVHAWCVWLPWISRSVCAIRQPCWKTARRQWKRSIYAVKAQTSLAPLSWCGPLRLVHANLLRTCTNVGRFQSYAKSRRLHAIANEIDMRNLQSVNRIPGIHDNGPHGPRCDFWL